MAEEPAKPASDDLFEDKTLRRARDRALGHMKWGPMMTAASRLMVMIGGPILTAGLLGVIGAAAGAASALSMSVALPVALAGVALTAAGIATEYIGSRYYQSGNLDQVEVGALSTARHLVQELKSSQVKMTFEQNTRSDGRTWVQATGRGTGELQTQV